MRSGTLDRRITIRSIVRTTSATGAVVESWLDLATVWASRRDVRGRELVLSGAERAVVERIYRIRHRPDVTPAMRVVDGSEEQEIVAVAEIGRRRALELLTRRIAAT